MTVQWSEGFFGEFSYRPSPGRLYRGRLYANIREEPRSIREDLEYPGGPSISTIWRQGRSDVLVIDRSARTFWKSTADGRINALSKANIDLPRLPAIIGTVIEKNQVGVDIISGRKATHWRVVAENRRGSKTLWEYWNDVTLHICLRAERAGDIVYEVTNIRDGRQPNEMFEIPRGFREVPPRKLPDVPGS